MAKDPIKKFIEHPYPVLLNGIVRHYAWGGTHFIPKLLGIPNPQNQPFAELWMGAHPQAPSRAVLNDTTLGLDELIAAAPEKILGRDNIVKLGPSLPYLLKILDARDMLSIQVHPSAAQAREGFAREEAAGIPWDAPHRSYKDQHHKPEVHVALTDFWMLHGFRPDEEISQVLRSTPEFSPLLPAFAGNDLRRLYHTLMTLPQDEVDAMLHPLLARLAGMTLSDKGNPDYWARLAGQNFALPEGRRDRGLFSIYLLNLVRLAPGQGTFQAAGVPHAYLQGINVELMANSDNVLRAGLTPKHIDVPELLKALSFDGSRPAIIDGVKTATGETVFPTPTAEFELCRIDLQSGERWTTGDNPGAEILVFISGRGTAQNERTVLDWQPGTALFLPANTVLQLCAKSAGCCYLARVPQTR